VLLHLKIAHVQSGLGDDHEETLPALYLDDRLVDLVVKDYDERTGEEQLTFSLALRVTIRGREARRAHQTWVQDPCEALCQGG
jgi:hypothetical protein